MRKWTASLAACTLALLSSEVIAAGLLDAYQAARQNDPTFKAARYERDAGQYAFDIGLAGLLPSVSINGSYLKTTGEQTSTVFTNVKQSLDYNSKYTVLGLRQPLFNYDSFVRYQQGGVQVAYSDAVFDKKEAELAVKVSGAYLDALYAADQLALADAEISAYRSQRELAERRRKGGEGTITDVAEAESRLQLARAGRADAVDRLSVAVRKLEGMTGKAMAPLWVLRPDFMPTSVLPPSLDEWSALANGNNTEIRSRRKAYELASLEVDRTRAGHMPQVDLVARGTQAESDTLSTARQKYYTNAIGVEFNFPLFAGGRVNALTGQAIANRERAQAELDGALTDTLVELCLLYTSRCV